ncbi:MAG: hypothetical protein IT201_01170, partial [Thermoleophilia bacterium]|nr:hypothetical protein [Thermoleophilia bacterium]
MRELLGRRRQVRATLVASVAALGLFLALGVGNAFAFSCAYAGSTVTITMANETVTVLKGTASAIMVNGAACGAATASNTDLIVVNGNGTEDTLAIDLGGGYFEPGATVEVAGINEIEWRLGTVGGVGAAVEELVVLGNASADLITIGAGIVYEVGTAPDWAEEADPDTDAGDEWGFVNLNDDEDADVFVDAGEDGVSAISQPGFSAYGRNGDDTLQGQGTKGTGAPTHLGLLLAGNTGDDSLIGADDSDWLVPGAGDDTVDGGDNETPRCSADTQGGAYVGNEEGDTVSFEDSPAAITADLDPGEAHPGRATGDGTDVLQNVENLNGSDFNDTLSGNNDANLLWGGEGDDTLAGDYGEDCVWGEGGNDTLNENEGVSVAEGGDGWNNQNDRLSGGAGADDVVDYSGRSTRVVVNLGVIDWENDGADPNADSVSEEGDDVFFDTENAKTGSGNDMISADFSNNQSDNEFWGNGGNDQMDGGAGNDTFHEGA